MIRKIALDSLISRLQERKLTFGSWLQLPSPDVAEIVAANFDWVVADLEHGGLDRSSLLHVVRAIEGRGAIPLARLMAMDPLLGRQALDSGCAGLMIPHTEDAEMFRAFVASCTWPPLGSRSVGFFRANDFGQMFNAYSEQAARPIFIPMIESRAGLDALDGILMTGHADAVLIGPYDLSASLGCLGDFTCDAYVSAESLVIDACARHGVSVGVHDVTPSSSSINDNIARGYTFIACGMDTTFLSTAVSNITSIDEVRDVHRP